MRSAACTRDGLSKEARQTRNSGLSEGFALLLELAAGSPNLGLCGLLPDLVRACGCKSLPLNQRQVLIELHHASMAAAIASVAIPRPVTTQAAPSDHLVTTF